MLCRYTILTGAQLAALQGVTQQPGASATAAPSAAPAPAPSGGSAAHTTLVVTAAPPPPSTAAVPPATSAPAPPAAPTQATTPPGVAVSAPAAAGQAVSSGAADFTFSPATTTASAPATAPPPHAAASATVTAPSPPATSTATSPAPPAGALVGPWGARYHTSGPLPPTTHHSPRSPKYPRQPPAGHTAHALPPQRRAPQWLTAMSHSTNATFSRPGTADAAASPAAPHEWPTSASSWQHRWTQPPTSGAKARPHRKWGDPWSGGDQAPTGDAAADALVRLLDALRGGAAPPPPANPQVSSLLRLLEVVRGEPLEVHGTGLAGDPTAAAATAAQLGAPAGKRGPGEQGVVVARVEGIPWTAVELRRAQLAAELAAQRQGGAPAGDGQAKQAPAAAADRSSTPPPASDPKAGGAPSATPAAGAAAPPPAGGAGGPATPQKQPEPVAAKEAGKQPGKEVAKILSPAPSVVSSLSPSSSEDGAAPAQAAAAKSVTGTAAAAAAGGGNGGAARRAALPGGHGKERSAPLPLEVLVPPYR